MIACGHILQAAVKWKECLNDASKVGKRVAAMLANPPWAEAPQYRQGLLGILAGLGAAAVQSSAKHAETAFEDAVHRFQDELPHVGTTHKELNSLLSIMAGHMRDARIVQ